MTRTPRGVTARKFIQALDQDGFVLDTTRGSHRVYRHPDGRRMVVAYHSSGATFKIGTLKAMIKDADWSDEDLKRLGLL